MEAKQQDQKRRLTFITQMSMVVILVIGFGLRIWGANWGRPLQLHPDEPAIMNNVERLLAGDSVAFFGWPGHANMFFTAAVIFLLEQISFEVDRYVVGRILTAIVSSGGAIFGYLFLKNFGMVAAISGFSFITFSPILITYSHYVTTDAWLASAFLAWLYFSSLIVNVSKLRLATISSGVLGAIAITIKFPGAVLVPLSFALVTFISLKLGKPALIRDYVLSFTMTFGTFGILVITNLDKVLARLLNSTRSTHLGIEYKNFLEKVVFYLDTFISWHGMAIFILALVGFLGILQSSRRTKILTLLPMVLGPGFLFAMSTLGLHWERWGLPAFAVILVASGIGVTVLAGFLGQILRGSNKTVMSLQFVLASVVVMNLAIQGAVASSKFLLLDTREKAHNWAASAGLDASNTAHEPYTAISPGWTNNKTTDCITADPSGFLAVSCPGVTHATVSSYMYGRILNQEDGYEQEKLVYNLLESQGDLVFEISSDPISGINLPKALPWSNELSEIVSHVGATGTSKGPTIKIYSLD